MRQSIRGAIVLSREQLEEKVIVDQILEALIKDREQVSSPEVFERKCLVRRLKEGPTNKTR